MKEAPPPADQFFVKLGPIFNNVDYPAGGSVQYSDVMCVAYHHIPLGWVVSEWLLLCYGKNWVVIEIDYFLSKMLLPYITVIM